MLSKVLPPRFSHALDFLDVNKLNEIRLRVGYPTIIYYGGRYYLGENGLADAEGDALTVTAQELNDLVFRACECSVYAHNEELKQGFITLSSGVRLGICGEIVLDNDKIKTIKNFSSINIRIPHAVKNCSLNALPFLHDSDGVKNTLVIAPPGAGKTTFIRDLATHLSDKFITRNLLIVDERNEISASVDGRASLYVGKYTDIYAGSPKQFGIINGVRTMSPDAIILDELATKEDIEAVNYVAGSGVKIIATAHSKDIYDLQNKPSFANILSCKLFDRFVVLSCRKGVGTIEGVWDKNNSCLFFG